MLSDIAINRETKTCGHYCYPSTLKKCCSCEDIRPIPPTGEGYTCYIDGIGYTTTAERDHGYCPVCNTKNYDRWLVRVQKDLEQKRNEDDAKTLRDNEKNEAAEKDRINNCGKRNGSIRYSNGDVYTGDLNDGQPHGRGKIEYGEASEDDAIYYDGEWVSGKHEGKGKKLWIDDMRYEGEWRAGTMHGKGTHHVNDVDILDGIFEEDEFCGKLCICNILVPSGGLKVKPIELVYMNMVRPCFCCTFYLSFEALLHDE